MHERERERGVERREDLVRLRGEIEAAVARLRRDPSDGEILNDLVPRAFHFEAALLLRSRLLRGRERAEEAAQRTCVRVFVEHLEKVLDEKVRLLPYLDAAARNAARDLLRDERILRGLRRAPFPGQASALHYRGRGPAASAAGAEEEEERIRRVVFSLPPALREVVRYRLERTPYSAIAAALGRSARSLRVDMARARRRLRTLLRRNGC